MDPHVKEPVTICQVPGADRVYLGHPSVLALPGGRLFAAVDYLGPDVRALPGQKSRYADTNHWMQGRLFVSNDEGQTWTAKQEYPFGHACLFRDGPNLYLLGHRGPLVIMRSADGGESWSKPVELAPKGGSQALYSHSPCSVLHADGHFYVALMRATTAADRRIWPHTLAPAMLQAAEGFNLTAPKSWTWSEPAPPFDQLVPADVVANLDQPLLGYAGAPPPAPASARDSAPATPGWQYPHAVRLTDPRHAWHDPAGRTTGMLSAVETPRGQWALYARFAEQPDGTLRLDQPSASPPKLPTLVPLPGGHRKFHVLPDPDAKLHWLLSSQPRGCFLQTGAPAAAPRPVRLNSHPHLLQLSFSNNLVDWFSAGWVAGSPSDPLIDPAMDIRGRDLCVVACGRDAADPANRHAKRLVFGLVRNFRSLAYGDA
ncbi:MAG: glycoside hydrolase [Lentisphaerae bacterium]|nr:glycoside hydrolase [Lentisphaerota bacterium]